MGKLPPVFYRLTHLIQDAVLDLKYGGLLRGSIKTRYGSLGSYDVANSTYAHLPDVFENRITDSDVLVDVGCGKGRVLNWWLNRGYRNKIIGLEIDGEVAENTRKRLAKYKNVTILCGDAVKNLPSDGTLFYVNNPFDAAVMKRFADRLIVLFGKRSGITLIYRNPRHLEVFKDDPRSTWIVNEFTTPFRYAVIQIRRQ